MGQITLLCNADNNSSNSKWAPEKWMTFNSIERRSLVISFNCQTLTSKTVKNFFRWLANWRRRHDLSETSLFVFGLLLEISKSSANTHYKIVNSFAHTIYIESSLAFANNGIVVVVNNGKQTIQRKCQEDNRLLDRRRRKHF